MSSESIASHPDRLLPADPATRSIARSLLADV
jgi:glucuronate isomerase